MPGIIVRPSEDDNALPRMRSPALAARLSAELSAVVVSAVERYLDFAPPGAADRAAAAVGEFLALYPDRPVRDNKGGSGFNDSLWVFVVARCLQPRLIVESGVFKGHTTWLLRQARPEAEIHCFDVNLTGRLVYRDRDAVLHECDWMEAPFPRVDGQSGLAFFDDHINQARRVREAYARGFRHLLFDDNFPAHNLYATGGPPVPTLDMILDDELRAGTAVSWTRKGKDYDYTYREEDVGPARELIARCHVLPDLSPVTRYSAGSGLTVVKLVD
ncbi:MAG: hypothetical protein OEU09_21055 [Rhodospirillales bacterium]|nr:hypothetical protein [Rhodospirillales bacterium]MDH3913776.1 hypothetical protein [Rhodospirillales bacterium]MDH3918499.1 hypothetical protein [Rhodospirillales bacterium]MDH3969721.1 hypothetical protein [Rhodospirillales bacterium]